MFDSPGEGLAEGVVSRGTGLSVVMTGSVFCFEADLHHPQRQRLETGRPEQQLSNPYDDDRAALWKSAANSSVRASVCITNWRRIPAGDTDLSAFPETAPLLRRVVTAMTRLAT
ncbi:hypothetical protein ACVXG8_01240 [Escherichia coli]